MSGGVDSSVAGYLLREQGYDVIGVTMKVWPQDCISRTEDKCCGPQAVADARAVAHSLGIPHYVVDEADQFERTVIDYFTSEYQAGRTPIPASCATRNSSSVISGGKAEALGCDFIRDGPLRHYRASPRSRGFAQRHRSAQRPILFSLQPAPAAAPPRADAAWNNAKTRDQENRAFVRLESRGQDRQSGDFVSSREMITKRF